MNINSLPNELLVKIFTKIESLALVYRLQIICRKWKNVAELTLRAQKSLRVCFRGVDLAPYGSLTFLKNRFNAKNTLWFDEDGLNRETIEYLVEKMPLVESFDLYKSPTEMEDLMFFLTSWQEQLSQLTIIFPIHLVLIDYEVQDQVVMMIERFNLRHLYLLGAEFDTDFMLPHFKQLQTIFHCDFNRNDNYNWHAALQSAGDQVESMHFVSPWLKSNKLDRAFPALKQLSMNVVSLENVKHVCDNFPSLTHLDLILNSDCELMKMLPHFSRLPNLTNLRLATLNELVPLGFEIPVVFPFIKITTRNYQRRLVQLPNVKRLHLSIELKVTRMRFLDHIFPNVEEITFNRPIFKCECQFTVIGGCARCSAAIYRHLIGFSKLRRVYSDANLLFIVADPQTDPVTVLNPLFYQLHEIIVPNFFRE